jgi:hypothetical protein
LSRHKPGLRLFSNRRPAAEAVVAALPVAPGPRAEDEAAVVQVRVALVALVEGSLQRPDVGNRPYQQ